MLEKWLGRHWLKRSWRGRFGGLVFLIGFTCALKRLADSQTPPTAVLFSGGGNDSIDKLLNCFNEVLKAVAAARGHVHYVDFRPTMTDNDWQEEIHPTFTGFDKITRKFRKVIQRTLGREEAAP